MLFQPAHVKACFLGSNLTVPLTDGKLNLGTWQGIWLCEHRDRAGSRKLLVTVNGALSGGSDDDEDRDRDRRRPGPAGGGGGGGRSHSPEGSLNLNGSSG